MLNTQNDIHTYSLLKLQTNTFSVLAAYIIRSLLPLLQTPTLLFIHLLFCYHNGN